MQLLEAVSLLRIDSVREDSFLSHCIHYSKMNALVRTAFASSTTCQVLRLRLSSSSALFPSWKQPASLRAPPELRNLRKPLKFGTHSGSGSLGRTFGNNTGNSGYNGGNADNGQSGELFASSPELEKLAMKSSDAPVLARVVSYNVLSSSLASPSHFRHCDPADLEASVRLTRVLSKLEEPVASRSVICLQEVSLSWSGPLHAFFASRGFHLVMGSYGSFFNGYMGVGLAFPTDLYEAVDIKVERITDMVGWPTTKGKSGFQKLLRDIQRAFSDMFCSWRGQNSRRSRTGCDPWTQSRDKRNIMIFARLRSRTNGARLCVGTYHMPCAFWSPPIMLIHSALVVSQFQALCGSDQAVLAGDFNIKPGDSAYNMITCGGIDPDHVDFPPKAPDGSSATKWFPNNFTPMKSAYKEVIGSEPDFTNYARIEDTPTFIETLDYLFCTNTVDVVDVIRLPHRDAVKGPLPVANEPSDHVMIGATLRLPPASSENADTATFSDSQTTALRPRAQHAKQNLRVR